METKVDATVIVLGYNAEFCSMYSDLFRIIVIEDRKKEVKVSKPNVTLLEFPILDDNCYNVASKLLSDDEVVFYLSTHDSIPIQDLNKMRLRMQKANREYSARAFCVMVKADKGSIYQARASIGHGFMFGTNPPKPLKNLAYISEDLFITHKKGE